MTVLHIAPIDIERAKERTLAIIRAYRTRERKPGGGDPYPPRAELIPSWLSDLPTFWRDYGTWVFWGELFQEVLVRAYPDWLSREAGVQDDGKHIQRADLTTSKGSRVECKLSTNHESTQKTMNASNAKVDVAVFGRLTSDRESIEVMGWLSKSKFPKPGTPILYSGLNRWDQ